MVGVARRSKGEVAMQLRKPSASLPLLMLLAAALLVGLVACDNTPEPLGSKEELLAMFKEYKAAAEASIPSEALLNSHGAISLLEYVLLDCNSELSFGNSENPEESAKWWKLVATKDYSWSARFDRITDAGEERWIVTGPGIEDSDQAGMVRETKGIWRITAGERYVTPLDGPAFRAADSFHLSPKYELRWEGGRRVPGAVVGYVC